MAFSFLTNLPQDIMSLPSRIGQMIAPNPSGMNAPTSDPYALMQRAQAYYQSPYATFSPNSPLGRLNPAIASGVDNGLLTLANMGPTGATAGENISNVARGLVGARNFNQERAMNAAMLPAQMQMMGLQRQDIESQIAQRQAQSNLEASEIPKNLEMEKYYMSH